MSPIVNPTCMPSTVPWTSISGDCRAKSLETAEVIAAEERPPAAPLRKRFVSIESRSLDCTADLARISEIRAVFLSKSFCSCTIERIAPSRRELNTL